MKPLNDLERRIIDISYRHKASHIGSCLTALPIIESIYEVKREQDKFVLSSGHAALAWYVVLEKMYGYDAEKLYIKHGTHPNRDIKDNISVSTGSLGHGIGIALGMAIADPTRDVYCLVSDGELSEGSCWETIRIAAEQGVTNFVVLVNANGYGAYKEIDLDRLQWQLQSFVQNNCPKISYIRSEQKYLKGLEAHYKVLTKEEYEEVIK